MVLIVEEKNAIKLSFALLVKEKINIAKVFYDNLFEMAPLIKPMFKNEREVIEKHFYDLISAAVNEIDHFEKFRPRLIELGMRHKEYGANIAHFGIVKAAFMLSIQYELKGVFNESMEVAWSKYIDNIAQAMIEGLSI